MATALPSGWTKRTARGYLEYVRVADGARVYQHPRRGWRMAEWCAHPPSWPTGDYVGTSRTEVIAWVERQYPVKES